MRGAEEVVDTLFPGIRVYAAEEVTTLDIPRETKREWGSGESDDMPVLLNEEDWNDPYLFRWAIYRTYLGKTNLFGHPSTEDGVWITSVSYAPHAHNAFLQMLFSHGLLTGVFFLVDTICLLVFSVVQTVRGRKGWIPMVSLLFTVAFVGFGLFEINWNVGQLSFFLLFFVHFPLLRKETER